MTSDTDPHNSGHARSGHRDSEEASFEIEDIEEPWEPPPHIPEPSTEGIQDLSGLTYVKLHLLRRDAEALCELLLNQSDPALWRWASEAAASLEGAEALSEAMWLARRREGIGGSDVGTILGLNARFTTPYQLWQRKLGLLPPDPSGPAAARGTRLEPWVVEQTSQALGVQIDPEGHNFLAHPRWDEGVCIQANTDGTIPHDGPMGPGLFEAKTCKFSRWPTSKAQEFLHGAIPASYLLQCQAYLAATGYRWGVIAAAIGPSDHDDWTPQDITHLVLLSFQAHPEVQRAIEEICAQFWECVTLKTPPGWQRHPRLPWLLRTLEQVRVRPAHKDGRRITWER